MQLTVKEALSYLKDPEEVNLVCCENVLSFNFHNPVEVEVWGDYVVSGILATGERMCEIHIDCHPYKKEAAAV